MWHRGIAVSACISVVALSLLIPKQHPAQAQVMPAAGVEFSRDIRPIFNKNCVTCHGGIKQASGLSLIMRDKTLQPANSGATPIVPGDPDHSELMLRVRADEADVRMPPPARGAKLSASEVAKLAQWIKEGAKWEEHWAYVVPKAQPLPSVSNEAWPMQSFDRFVLQRLDQEKLKPSAPANRFQWLRRVSFDLTGLPPTPADVQAFLDDQRSDAFERVVDRLLASPAYGERWASMWLDLSRYADTNGFERDAARTVWPYRDWLIRSLNADMPYDQFVVRQLAGDLLPDATIDDRVATVFHRNTQTNAEGGTDDEEFRVAAVIDRVNTTWEAFQGVTFRCTQCHSHPYDPIEESEFYRFYALFNQTRDWDLKSDAPLLRVPTNPDNFARAQQLDKQITSARQDEAAQVQATAQQAQGAWRPLRPTHAVSTRLTELVLQPEGEFVDVVSKGTVSHGSRFTIDIPIPDSVKQLTALRVEGLPKNIEVARLTPELGFVISQIRAAVLPPGTAPPATQSAEQLAASVAQLQQEQEQLQQQQQQANAAATAPSATATPQTDTAAGVASEPPADPAPAPTAGRGRGGRRGGGAPAGPQEPPIDLPGTEIQFTHVFGDEFDPFQDPEASLNRDAGGWGALPRIDRPRSAVFTPAEPVNVPAGSVIRIVMTFNNAAGDDMPHVMNRGRFAISQAPQWSALVRDDAFNARRTSLAMLAKERDAIGSVLVPVMQEQDPGQRRTTAAFKRGSWLDKGEVVAPGIPKLFGQLPANAPADRLALARWLVSKDNPLTARVQVNRLWEQLFGTGLVETAEDFGSSGTPPSHPELLDFLALRFQNELGWSTKKMLRELVLSATYRQDASVRPDLIQKDQRNRLLARGPRTRLTAEMVRDQALAVSGLLASTMYGPPVMPPQPDGIWRSVYNNTRWQTSQGEDKYRRGIYTFWKRTAGYPSFAMFDAPSREICTARRIPTNTPLQALITLNDPVYIECAQALAGRMSPDGVTEPPKQFALGWELTVGRKPDDAAVQLLLGLYQRSLDRFRNDAEASTKLATTPERAALTVVANAILNLDELVTK